MNFIINFFNRYSPEVQHSPSKMMFGKPVSNFWRVTLGVSEASSSPQNAAGSQGNEVRGDGANVSQMHQT